MEQKPCTIYTQRSAVINFIAYLQTIRNTPPDKVESVLSCSIKVGSAFISKCSISAFDTPSAHNSFLKADKPNNIHYENTWNRFCYHLNFLQAEWINILNKIVPRIHPMRQRIYDEYSDKMNELTAYLCAENEQPAREEAFQTCNPQYSTEISLSVHKETQPHQASPFVILCVPPRQTIGFFQKARDYECSVDLILRLRYKASVEKFCVGFYCVVKSWTASTLNLLLMISQDIDSVAYVPREITREYNEKVSLSKKRGWRECEIDPGNMTCAAQ